MSASSSVDMGRARGGSLLGSGPSVAAELAACVQSPVTGESAGAGGGSGGGGGAGGGSGGGAGGGSVIAKAAAVTAAASCSGGGHLPSSTSLARVRARLASLVRRRTP